jgi:hydroxymethylbilane synthase
LSIDRIRIATRQSKLALWQANFIKSELERVHDGLVVEIVGITTKGDRWLQSPLSEIGGKGLFVKELESAMLAGEADIAVHSVKDLPAELPPEFVLPVLSYREDVRDVLVSDQGDLAGLPHGAVVGSSSLRRQAQLKAVRPDLNMRSIRGNVDTRLAKLKAGEFDAIVLAAAGLNRLGLQSERSHLLDTEVCLPAPGQGALGIECCEGSPAQTLLTPLQDEAVARCVIAERGISAGLGADCSLPIAAYACLDKNDQVELLARIANEDGSQILHSTAIGQDPDVVAQECVASLISQGAEQILTALRHA